MSIFSLASSCAINAERRSGRMLLYVSNIVLTFQQASLSLFPPFKACGKRRFTFEVFRPHLEDVRWPRWANWDIWRQPLFRPPFLGPSPSRASTAVPRKGCLVAQGAAGWYCHLRVNIRRPIRFSCLCAGLGLRLHPFPVAAGLCQLREMDVFYSPALWNFNMECSVRTPGPTRVRTPDATRVRTPGPTRVRTPDASRVRTDATRVRTPDATRVRKLGPSRVRRPDATRVRRPDPTLQP